MADQAPTPSNAPATAEQKPASDQQMLATVDPKPTMTKKEPAAKRKSKRKKDRSSKEAKHARIEKRKRYKAQIREDRKERKRKAREEKAAEKERLKKAKVEQTSAGPAELPTKSTDDRPICIHCRERFDPNDYRLPYACFGNRRKSPAQARTQVN